MNWEAVGAIGEFVSAIAVLVTLIYLAGQVRSAAKATESQVHASLSSELERLSTVMAQDEFLSSALIAAQNREKLSEQQILRLGWWFGGFLRVCESHVLQGHLGATKIDVNTPVLNILKGFNEVPYFQTFFSMVKSNRSASPVFLEWLEENGF